jgi:hypothetical protein
MPGNIGCDLWNGAKFVTSLPHLRLVADRRDAYHGRKATQAKLNCEPDSEPRYPGPDEAGMKELELQETGPTLCSEAQPVKRKDKQDPLPASVSTVGNSWPVPHLGARPCAPLWRSLPPFTALSRHKRHMSSSDPLALPEKKRRYPYPP